jgi:hypothetical protein
VPNFAREVFSKTRRAQKRAQGFPIDDHHDPSEDARRNEPWEYISSVPICGFELYFFISFHLRFKRYYNPTSGVSAHPPERDIPIRYQTLLEEECTAIF